MNVSIDFEVDIRCVGCGAQAVLSDGSAQRVLHVDDVIYADVDRRCRCGSRRVRVQVKLDGQEAPNEDRR